MKDGEPVLDGVPVWRLPERRAKYYTRAQRLPTLEAFRLRPGEERASVWDGAGKISVARVIELRGKAASEVAVVALTTDAVRRVGASLQREDVRVVGEPNGAPNAATDHERALHYGIEGLALHLAPNEARHLALLSRLAQACTTVRPTQS